MEQKMWGKSPFWGLDNTFDPTWVLTDGQKEIQKKLIELCRTKIRPGAVNSDRNYVFPRASLDALAEQGLLGLFVPKDLGGLGQNHKCACMVVETIARYGCPNTAMVYIMHLLATTVLLLCYHDNKTIQDVLKRLNKDKLVGTTALSDPGTGGHFWFPLSSKCRLVDEDHIQLLKYASWATSAGFADFYITQTVSPNSGGIYRDLTSFLIFKDETRTGTEEWAALGMHGNQSGPVIFENIVTTDRIIGKIGTGEKLNSDAVSHFLLCTAACWNGVSLACLDVAKKHVTRRAHGDVGQRVCDYPTIQDNFGECVCETSNCRIMVFHFGDVLDKATDNCNWDLHADPDCFPRMAYQPWLWQVRFTTAKNVSLVSEKMMQTCGGSGYKEELGLERLYRDSKAAWVMAPSNEVLRQMVGKAALLGLDSIDLWDEKINTCMVHHELKKMNIEQKKALAEELLKDVENSKPENAAKNNSFQDTDFYNPFNTEPPVYVDKVITTADGKSHRPALNPSSYVSLKLKSRWEISNKMASFVFRLPNATDHTGCFPGQYIRVRICPEGKPQERYFSPVSLPTDYGEIELVLKFETSGILSQHFRNLKPGHEVEFKGPCGGFEYKPNSLEMMTLIASGGGITPGLQLIRSVMSNPEDKTSVTLLYYSETVEDIICREELQKYADHDKRLKLFLTLGECCDSWEGEEGHIDRDMIERYMAKPNCFKHKIILCGGPAMVISCLQNLHKLGYSSEDIFIYGPFGVQQIQMVYGNGVKLSGHCCDMNV